MSFEETFQLRLLEGVGGEEKTFPVPTEFQNTFEVFCDNPELLQVAVQSGNIQLLPLKAGKTSLTLSNVKIPSMSKKWMVEIDWYEESGNYHYKNVPVPGGGFVTGFVFHPTTPNILYCRTDIGGCYRYDFEKQCWISLIDHATDKDAWETYPLSIALDPQNPSYVYTMVGNNQTNKIGFSGDYGKSWTYVNAPTIDELGHTTRIHGNAPSRSTGERLVVSPLDSNTLFLGTMQDGLWKTIDRGQTWHKLAVAYPGCTSETSISFIEINPQNPKMIIVGTNGEKGSQQENVRGQSVYISLDEGNTFKPLLGEPNPIIEGQKDYPGYVGQRASFLNEYLFITYSAYNIGRSTWNHYGCDLGAAFDGAVYRFTFNEIGEVIEAKDITPPNLLTPLENTLRRLGYGMSGISTYPDGSIICSSICSHRDTVYHSIDFGQTWQPILSGLSIGKIEFTVPYHKPEYNGNHSLIHWMSDIKMNPFNPDMALFNTGAGVFMTHSLRNANKNQDVIWFDASEGMEETVHLNIYCPPKGNVKLIDIIGDYGGFVFTDLDQPAENTFVNENNDRWITCMNADYPDYNPNLIVTTPRGNWTGKTKGGLILSYDEGKTWKQLNDPIGLTDEIDLAIEQIKKPNVTSGWTAISSDGLTILWAIGRVLSSNRLVYTYDEGLTWGKSEVYDLQGNRITEMSIPFKVMSDRVNPNLFYGFSELKNQLFISRDKGRIFTQVQTPNGFPEVNLAGIDGRQIYEIRVESDKEGVFLIAMLQYGLWKFTYDINTHSLTGKCISKPKDNIKRIGFGKAKADSSYKTLFTSGTIDGIYGFYRSHDEGNSWIRINDDFHNYGDIRSITGDNRIFGRIYVATGTRGVVYGDPIWFKKQ